jgi:membrane-bound metal-dependent hydrolase YbcI (DUF457 family)
MDILSHTLWGKALFGYRGRPWLAAFFGACPDLFSLGILLIIRIVKKTYAPGPPPLDIIPGWIFLLYNITHSFVIAFIIIGLVWFWKKDVAFSMLAWVFHICLDFPFHTKYYFPTKLFWPLSDFFIDGVRWGNPWVWYPNLGGIVIVFFLKLRKVYPYGHK